MNRIVPIALGALLAGGLIGWFLHPTASPSASGSTSDGREVLYWYDPMHPDQHFDKPGRSPFMDMDLVPRYADGGAGGGAGIAIDARTVQNLGVRTDKVARVALDREIRAAGSIAFDPRATETVAARVPGFIRRIAEKRPYSHVRRGDVLATFVAPEWSAALAEYAAVKSASTALPELAAAARARLRVLGVPDAAVRAAERGTARDAAVALVAPRDGVLAAIEVVEGEQVAAGQPLFRITGLDTVWLEVALPESDAAGISAGLAASARLTAWPGRVFHGHVAALVPDVDAATRTMKLRIELDNTDGALAPGMFAEVRIDAATDKTPALSVPSEAVIRTGTRAVALVEESPGRFLPHEVTTGREVGGRTEILEGLAEGDLVVTSGQFLIDSEANLRGALRRLGESADADHDMHGMDHGAMDHGAMDHGPMHHDSMDHGSMDHAPAAHDSAPAEPRQ